MFQYSVFIGEVEISNYCGLTAFVICVRLKLKDEMRQNSLQFNSNLVIGTLTTVVITSVVKTRILCYRSWKLYSYQARTQRGGTWVNVPPVRISKKFN